jgi:hypothetical protein
MTQSASDAGASLLCQWCDEAVTEDELRMGDAEVNRSGQAIHIECGLRSAIGSVGHQRRLCSCHGGDQEDPPGMTRREAARAAMEYFHLSRANGKMRP